MTGGVPDASAWAACTGLLTRAGIRSLSLVWSASTAPTWSASALDSVGNRVAAAGLGPGNALAALTERIAGGLRCECGRPIAISDRTLYGGGACRWRLQGQRFVSGHGGHNGQAT